MTAKSLHRALRDNKLTTRGICGVRLELITPAHAGPITRHLMQCKLSTPHSSPKTTPSPLHRGDILRTFSSRQRVGVGWGCLDLHPNDVFTAQCHVMTGLFRFANQRFVPSWVRSLGLQRFMPKYK